MNTIIKSIGFKTLEMASDLKAEISNRLNERDIADYLRSDRRPWRTGYSLYRIRYLENIIHDSTILEIFRQSAPLPINYGFRLDARVVEIPWVLSRLNQMTGHLLDAGSSFNQKFLLTSPHLSNKKITIVTLAPEGESHWQMGISYVFGDLRDLDFREDAFDMIACISTIEHVGMDNTMYAGDSQIARKGGTKEFIQAAKELKRVLKPGGVLYCTFPFGSYEDHGWFQQFDAQLADELIEAFQPESYKETVFQYDPNGWKLSDRTSCAKCQFFDVHKSKYFDPNSTLEYPPDYPAGERAVLCLELFR